jgi:hypothetical protein
VDLQHIARVACAALLTWLAPNSTSAKQPRAVARAQPKLGMEVRLTRSIPSRRNLRLLLCCALALLGCGVSSPLFVADSDNEVEVHSPRVDGGMSLDAGAPHDSGPSEPEVVTRPAPPCGSGPGCNPGNLGGETCESLGLGGGTLLCDPTSCTFAVTFCTGLGQRPPCGSGPGCDPDDLGNKTCESLGLPAGSLSCDPMTCTYDTSLCVAAPANPGGGLFGGGGLGAGTGGRGGTGGTGGRGFFGGGGGTTGFFGGNFFGGGNQQDEDGGV